MAMTGKELADTAEKLYGPNWRPRLATVLKKDPSSIRRWVGGKTDVPVAVELTLRSLLKIKEMLPNQQ